MIEGFDFNAYAERQAQALKAALPALLKQPQEVLKEQRLQGYLDPPSLKPWSHCKLIGRRVRHPLSDPKLVCQSCVGCGSLYLAAELAQIYPRLKKARARAEARGEAWVHPTRRRAELCDHCAESRRLELAAAAARRRRAERRGQRLGTCVECGKSFPIERRTARFCSTNCRVKAHRKKAEG